MNSVSYFINQVQWTRFTSLIPLHQQFLVTWVLSWKSSLLDSISMNGPQPSTCCCGSQLGPVFPPCSSLHSLYSPLSYSISSLLSQYTYYFPKLSHTTLISHNISGIFIQYCDYLLVFFFKKNLEHIRKSYVFFFCQCKYCD